MYHSVAPVFTEGGFKVFKFLIKMEFIAILHLSKTSLESYFGHFEPIFGRKPLYFGKLAAKSLDRFSLAAPVYGGFQTLNPPSGLGGISLLPTTRSGRVYKTRPARCARRSQFITATGRPDGVAQTAGERHSPLQILIYRDCYIELTLHQILIILSC